MPERKRRLLPAAREKIPNKKKETEKDSFGGVEAESGFSVERLSNDFAPWQEGYLSVSKRFRSRRAIYGVYRVTNRVGQTDNEMTVGFYQPLGRRSTVFVEASASPTHRILPKFTTFVQFEQAFKKGWGAQIGWRHTEFRTARTNTGIFTAEKYFSAYRAAYTLYLINLAVCGGISAAHRENTTAKKIPSPFPPPGGAN